MAPLVAYPLSELSQSAVSRIMNLKTQIAIFLSVFLSDVSVRNVVAVARKFTTKISFAKPERKFTICDVSLVPFAENNSPRVKCCTCSQEMTDSSAEITTSNKVR